MSGTSLDGIDAVLVDLSQSKPLQLGKNYLPFDDTLKNALLALHLPAHNELHQAQLIGNQLATMYAAAVAPLLAQAKSSNREIKAVGCHGQTIRHCPEHGYSVQIGNAALLAELTGITVVSDFRSRDIAAGGQGAPLVPAFHDHVLRHPDIHRVIVNIGGISNLTNLPPGKPTTGFDCGPGNLLMDAWCMQHLGKSYDDNGAWAASGSVLPALLGKLLDESYFALPPPKSSGRDLFNMAWLQNKLQGNEDAANVQATMLSNRLRDGLTSQLQQGGLYVRSNFIALQFALQPAHIEQIAPCAFGWRQRKERFIEQFFQQRGQHTAGCCPLAIVVIGFAQVLHAPGIHQQVAGAAVET